MKNETERKFKTSDISRKTEKQEISKEDFDILKKSASPSIIRDRDSQLVKMSSEQIKKIVALCNSENITNIF